MVSSNTIYFLFPPAIVLCVGIIVFPTKEIGFDHDYFYYIQRSVFSRFTSVKRYPIMDIVSVKLAFEPKHRYDWNGYRVELIFSDTTSQTLLFTIRRKVLEFVLREVIRLKKEKLKASVIRSKTVGQCAD